MTEIQIIRNNIYLGEVGDEKTYIQYTESTPKITHKPKVNCECCTKLVYERPNRPLYGQENYFLFIDKDNKSTFEPCSLQYTKHWNENNEDKRAWFNFGWYKNCGLQFEIDVNCNKQNYMLGNILYGKDDGNRLKFDLTEIESDSVWTYNSFASQQRIEKFRLCKETDDWKTTFTYIKSAKETAKLLQQENDINVILNKIQEDKEFISKYEFIHNFLDSIVSNIKQTEMFRAISFVNKIDLVIEKE